MLRGDPQQVHLLNFSLLWLNRFYLHKEPFLFLAIIVLFYSLRYNLHAQNVTDLYGIGG